MLCLPPALVWPTIPSPVNKNNIYIVAALCVWIAVKFNEDTKEKVKNSLISISKVFEVSSSQMIECEMSVLIALGFNLARNEADVMERVSLLLTAMNKSYSSYFDKDIYKRYIAWGYPLSSSSRNARITNSVQLDERERLREALLRR